ncbi:hypothetical protein ACLB2K_049957 [Fragaria x ananassa]
MFHSRETSPGCDSLSHHYYDHRISKVPERLWRVNEQENYMSNYVVFMDRLVNTAQDVEFLVKKGIFENVVINKLAADGVIVDTTFANHQGSTLIKKLVEGVIMDPNYFYFGKLCENLNEYCISSRNYKKRIAFIVLFLLMVAQLVRANH